MIQTLLLFESESFECVVFKADKLCVSIKVTTFAKFCFNFPNWKTYKFSTISYITGAEAGYLKGSLETDIA